MAMPGGAAEQARNIYVTFAGSWRRASDIVRSRTFVTDAQGEVFAEVRRAATIAAVVAALLEPK
jgi:hypothetical protein